jgi:hypothetical protein
MIKGFRNGFGADILYSVWADRIRGGSVCAGCDGPVKQGCALLSR